MAIIASKHWFTLLRLSVFFVFIGKTYQFIFFSTPFKAVLTLPVLENLIDKTWLESVEVDYVINLFTTTCGFLFLLAAVTSLCRKTI